MSSIQSVSVLIPTLNGMEFLARLLDALACQELELPWEVWVIDSGSDDGTWELLGERAETFPVPLARERIDPVEFDHGDTRNLLAARSSGDLLCFLTQDAVPIGPDWLATLAGNFDDPSVGAATCRNVVRPGADVLTRVFAEADPGYAAQRRQTRLPEAAEYAALDPHQRRLLYNFNDVASAVRRELWERHPFPRTAFGEDVLMARALLEAGFTVVYDAEAAVEHSHDYDAEQCRERARIDGRFNAEWLDRVCVASRADAETLTERQLVLDRRALEEAGCAGAELRRSLDRARELRRATFVGLWEGGRSAVRHPATRALERTELSALFVVHGFPPDTWAGTEIYTQNLASELERRGHRCTILARVPAPEGDEGPEDFDVAESEFQGLRVLRMTHRLRHANLRESYQQPRAEEAFRRILLRERPDVVHFQHLIHTSAGLVDVAREAGVATVVHCHDYWALCARVQLIRPDGVRCDQNMGSGCFLCVKEKPGTFAHIPRLARLDRVAGGLLDGLARGLRRGRALGERAARRWEGFGDMRARHEFVVGAYAAADLRISPSRFLRSKHVESAGFDPHTFLFSDNGMRTDHVRALEKTPDPEGRVRFGFVGSLVWYKGDEVMVRAMQLLRGTRAVLNVYGDFRPEEDRHHAELARRAEGAPVVFKGRFDNARLSEVYAEIDVLVVPSIWFENSPITIHEAFLTRTPVLASDIGGMAEFVRDGVDGLHFEVGNPEDLAAKMRRFIDEPNLAADLSRDFMEIKTIDQNAAETEFRYRALACRVRERGPRTLLALGAHGTSEREGPVEEQGPDLLLLRPGAAVEYELAGAGGGERELALEVLALGGEPDLALGARVLVDGREVGTVGPVLPEGGDTRSERVLRVELDAEARCLRVEPTPGLHLRLSGLRLREAAESVGGPS
ncbi:MAG: glycosyltransferase [Planctomycetota bacterium]|jgi:glycosyltransferase involved in cell wall biosynthesis|nr:glycosyltransferase [Planctomycetota bacterium]MDP6761771.1 glycosyltransferase [Planctomycetota bacterium]MDP6988027.1 glycosyltransferase [Planctomycetota bacterium]